MSGYGVCVVNLIQALSAIDCTYIKQIWPNRHFSNEGKYPAAGFGASRCYLDCQGSRDAAYRVSACLVQQACNQQTSMAHSVNCKLLQSYRRWNTFQNQPLHKDCRNLRVSCISGSLPGKIEM